MVTTVGICCVDHLMIIDGFKGSEGSYNCREYRVDGGGMAATAACAAARLGSSARIFSRIGDDLNGRFILNSLRLFDVDVSGVIELPGKHSIASFVLIDSHTGEKQFYSKDKIDLFGESISPEVSMLEGTKVLLVDDFGMETGLQAAKWASARGIPIVGDFKSKCEGLEELLPCISYLILPHFFARELTELERDGEILRALKSMIPGIPVITKGSEGGAYLLDGQIRSYRTFPVRCIDSTGAGDAFHGAFCHFIAKGIAVDRCLELASAVGGMNCRALGGRSALPTGEELSEFLRQQHGSDPELIASSQR